MSIENTDLGRINKMLSMLPPGLQTEQYLQAAAQGANPQVPQFLALAQLQKIAADKQRAQQMAMAAQAGPQPDKTLKDKTLESTGVMGLLAARQAQAQQQMAGQMAAQPQPTPPGVGQAPVQAASGGLMGRRFAKGGSAEEDDAEEASRRDVEGIAKALMFFPRLFGRAIGAPGVTLDGEPETTTRAKGPDTPYPEPLAVREGRRGEPTPMPEAPPPAAPSGGITELMGPPAPKEEPFSWGQEQREMLKRLRNAAPGQSPEELRTEMAVGLPELLKKPQEGLLKEIEARRTADAEEAAALKAGLAKDRQAAVINALLGASQNSSNRGALVDLGRGLMAGRSQVQEREQAINELVRTRDTKMMESQAAAVEAQRAHAEGRFDDMWKFREKAAADKKAAMTAEVQIINSGATNESRDRQTQENQEARLELAQVRADADTRKARLDAANKRLLAAEKAASDPKTAMMPRADRERLQREVVAAREEVARLERGGATQAPTGGAKYVVGRARYEQLRKEAEAAKATPQQFAQTLRDQGIKYDPNKP